MQRIEALTAEVRELHKEATRLREAVGEHTRTLQVRTRIVAVLLAVVVVLGVLAAWQLHTQLDQSRRASADLRQLCQIVSLLADSSLPASTPRGLEVAKRASALAEQLHC